MVFACAHDSSDDSTQVYLHYNDGKRSVPLDRKNVSGLFVYFFDFFYICSVVFLCLVCVLLFLFGLCSTCDLSLCYRKDVSGVFFLFLSFLLQHSGLLLFGLYSACSLCVCVCVCAHNYVSELVFLNFYKFCQDILIFFLHVFVCVCVFEQFFLIDFLYVEFSAFQMYLFSVILCTCISMCVCVCVCVRA